MEAWIPLFNIFLNSPSPESEASRWFQQSSDAMSSSSSLTFLSLLTKPIDTIVIDSSSPPHQQQRVMWIQTLPPAVQSRVLSFLRVESNRFCSRDLCAIARNVLKGNQEIDFWVKKAAYNLLDAVSEPSYECISGLSLRIADDFGSEEFESLPGWLNDVAKSNNPVLSWLPVSFNEFPNTMFRGCDDFLDSLIEDEEDHEEISEEVVEIDSDMISSANAVLDTEVQRKAASLKTRIMNFESTSKTVDLASEIRELCLKKGAADSFAVLGLIEPWKIDDESASVLISHLFNENEELEELGWPSQILSAIILPKFLALEKPPSRVLLNAAIEYCKIHQKASVHALLLPLILRVNGINNFICDVLTRVMKECLHSAHVSAFCHTLLCGEEGARKFTCLPNHRPLVSHDLLWTESLFSLFQNILNHNVYLAQGSVDFLVYNVCELAERFSKSLKFGNFLLCLVTKCSALLNSHKLSLMEAVEHTNTLVTKSVLAKLANL